MPVSKNKIKLIHSLEQKKGRRQNNAFVAEGFKVVGDLINAGFRPQFIVATEEWVASNSQYRNTSLLDIVTDEELRKISFLQHPQQVLAVFSLPESSEIPSAGWFGSNLCLALDGVQDPGNLGTIIRIADWFGIDTILCSLTTADAFAPKVVQATMGSISRVRILYCDLKSVLQSLPSGTPVYGTLLDGEDLYTRKLSEHGVIIMGNEGNGISDEIRTLVNSRLLIPSFPPDSPTAESLNVAIATAITVAEFRRRSHSLPSTSFP